MKMKMKIEFIVVITHVTEQQSNEIPSNNSVQET